MAVLKYYNTATSAWEYIAASTTANFTTWKKTMAGGETSVSGTDDNGVTLSYTAGLEQVFINGALQARGSDYTATNGTSVTGLSALSVNDIVSVVCYAPFNVANTYTQAQTNDVAAAATGLRMVIPTNIAVGSGTGSVDANGAVTFSGASSVSLNGCFTSTYDNYRIVINVTSASGTGDRIRFQLRASGTNTATNYASNGFYWQLNGGASGLEGNQSAYIVMGYSSGTNWTHNVSDIISPFLSAPTATMGLTVRGDAYAVTSAGLQSDSTSFDGFTISPLNAVNITGTIRVYGYKD